MDGADIITGAIGKKHLDRYGRWCARRCVSEAKEGRMFRHLGGNRKLVDRESEGSGKMAVLLVPDPA